VAVETPGTGGRRQEYLTLEQERAFLEPFFARAAAGEIATAAEIQRAFEAQVQHPVHPSTSFRLLNRHAWRKLVPRPVHPKADSAEQAAFKKTLRRPSKPRSPPVPKTDQRPVLKMAEDEGRFGRVSLKRRAWAPPGVRPRAKRQIVREDTDVSAAVAPAEGKMTSLILPTANTALMQRFLEHVSRTFADSFMVMQVDRAGWHGAKALGVRDEYSSDPATGLSSRTESSGT
jgi:hypothetical protein